MAETKSIGGFNTRLQHVDERYNWINEMIKARQELVTKYMELLNLYPETSAEAPGAASANSGEAAGHPSAAQVTAFCGSLIDYISHGHFDLYPKIIELIENASGRSLSIARRVMPRIESSTEYLMRFNDRYSEDPDEEKLKTLKGDLSEVGKCLEHRFRYEDRLIIGLRLVHSLVESPDL